MTNVLLLSSDCGCISLLVLLDLSAAFDTINHNIHLNRLENFVGISGSALAWFKCYPWKYHQETWVSFHCYADDTQLYISSRPGETHQIEKLMECIVDIKNWMTNNFLMIIFIGPNNHTSNNLKHCLTLDGCSLDSSSSVRKLGVLFQSNLSFDSHVSSICKTALFHLKKIYLN